MKKLVLLLILTILPSICFALEQSFTRNGLEVAVKLSPEKLVVQDKINLSLTLRRSGAILTDREVTLEVYERNADQPIIKRKVDFLDTAYCDSLRFEKAGEYKVILSIVDPGNRDDSIRYEVNATVVTAGMGHKDHGFFSHHMGGWWGAGFMIVMMTAMLLLML